MAYYLFRKSGVMSCPSYIQHTTFSLLLIIICVHSNAKTFNVDLTIPIVLWKNLV